MTDRRFEDLLQQASAFFAQAERDPEAERQAAIAEISWLSRLRLKSKPKGGYCFLILPKKSRRRVR